MRYEIIFAPQAIQDFEHLSARDRSLLRAEVETHLRYEPEKVSKSRIKRLRGIKRPQYRLRIGEFRVYYDVSAQVVEILAIVSKGRATEWLNESGERE